MSVSGEWALTHVYNDEEGKLICDGLEALNDERHQSLLTAKRRVGEYYASQNVTQSVFTNRDDVLMAIVNLAKYYSEDSRDVEKHYGTCKATNERLTLNLNWLPEKKAKLLIEQAA